MADTVSLSDGRWLVDSTGRRVPVSALDGDGARANLVEVTGNNVGDLFTVVPLTLTDNTVTLTGTGGIATWTGSGSGAGNDRRAYILNGFSAENVEAHIQFTLADHSAQVGLVLRRQGNRAIVAWSNVVFSVSANFLTGCWEWVGGASSSLALNQQATLGGLAIDAIGASSSGGTVTVQSKYVHGVNVDELIDVSGIANFGGNQTTTALVHVGAFQFSNATSGTPWTGGNFKRLFSPAGTHMKARLIGNRLSVKGWLRWEPEPHWGDTARTVHVTIPNPLSSGAAMPTGPGDAGLLVAHLGTTRSFSVSSATFESLD